MLWIAISVILIIAGAFLFNHAIGIDSAENYQAYYKGIGGIVLIVIGLVSGGVKWIFF